MQHALDEGERGGQGRYDRTVQLRKERCCSEDTGTGSAKT